MKLALYRQLWPWISPRDASGPFALGPLAIVIHGSTSSSVKSLPKGNLVALYVGGKIVMRDTVERQLARFPIGTNAQCCNSYTIYNFYSLKFEIQFQPYPISLMHNAKLEELNMY